MRLLQFLQLVSEPAEGLRSVLLELFAATQSQLADDLLRLSIWLPGDEEPLEERTAALAQWCTGFLAGLSGSGGGLGNLSEDAAEALEDLRQIAQAESGDGVSEEEETAFFEVVEYLRVVTLLLREELRGPKPDEAIH